MLYDIVLCGSRREDVENKLEEWRRAVEDRGLNINKKKTVYLRFNDDGNLDGNSESNLLQGEMVYKTLVRPAMMYGAETWAVKKAQEKKLDVAEMRTLSWLSGVLKLDCIMNERIRGTTKVGEISRNVQESRLK